MSPLDEIRFWAQVTEDARRVILCSPENESRLKTGLAVRGYGLYEVRATPAVPDSCVYIMDEQGIEADQRAWLASNHMPWR